MESLNEVMLLESRITKLIRFITEQESVILTADETLKGTALQKKRVECRSLKNMTEKKNY